MVDWMVEVRTKGEVSYSGREVFDWIIEASTKA